MPDRFDRTPLVHTYLGLIELSDELKAQVSAGTMNRLLAVERMMAAALGSMTYGPKALQKTMMRDMGMVALDFRKWVLRLPPIEVVPGRAQVASPKTKILVIASRDHIARHWWNRQGDDFHEKYVMWVATTRNSVLQSLRGTIDMPVYIVNNVPWLDQYLWDDIKIRTQFFHTEEL
jgi:hypothetical protein